MREIEGVSHYGTFQECGKWDLRLLNPTTTVGKAEFGRVAQGGRCDQMADWIKSNPGRTTKRIAQVFALQGWTYAQVSGALVNACKHRNAYRQGPKMRAKYYAR